MSCSTRSSRRFLIILLWMTMRYGETNAGKTSRVFHITMGSAQDFKSEGLRRLTVNAAYWCQQMEADIDESSSMDIVGDYNPPDSGFAYKQLNIVPRKPSFYK